LLGSFNRLDRIDIDLFFLHCVNSKNLLQETSAALIVPITTVLSIAQFGVVPCLAVPGLTSRQ